VRDSAGIVSILCYFCKTQTAPEIPGLVKRGKTMKTYLSSEGTPEADTITLLLRSTERNACSIAALFPGESEDFIQGYIAGHIAGLRLALEHVKDVAAQKT
jgi:hypothetical protein